VQLLERKKKKGVHAIFKILFFCTNIWGKKKSTKSQNLDATNSKDKEGALPIEDELESDDEEEDLSLNAATATTTSTTITANSNDGEKKKKKAQEKEK